LDMFAVLGATGKAGGAAIRALRQNGLAVRAVVRDRAKAHELEALGCEIALADLGDAKALAKAIDGATAVQAICPVCPQGDDPAKTMRAFVDTLRSALIAARPAHVLAISDYGAERSAGITLAFHYLEAQLRNTCPALTLLRSAEQMQNWARLFKTAAETGVLPSMHHPLIKQFPMVSAQDVGLVAADLLASPNGPQTQRIVRIEGPRRYRTRRGQDSRLYPESRCRRSRTASDGLDSGADARRTERPLCRAGGRTLRGP